MLVATAAEQTSTATHINPESFYRLGDRFQRQPASPCAQLRARPIDFRRHEIASIELVHQEHENIFLFHRPCLRHRPGRGKRHGLAVALQLTSA